MDQIQSVEKLLLPLEADKPVTVAPQLVAKSDIKEKTSRKKTLTDNLVIIMKSNSIDCFDINGGALLYKQKKTKKPISAKYLLAELQKIYKDQPEVATDLTKQLLDNRGETVKDEICRKINK